MFFHFLSGEWSFQPVCQFDTEVFLFFTFKSFSKGVGQFSLSPQLLKHRPTVCFPEWSADPSCQPGRLYLGEHTRLDG